MRNIIVIFLLNIIIIILIFLSGCDNSVNTTTSSTVETSTTINPNSDITFKVTVPINTPVTDNIYITGDFENWTGGMAGYKLTKNSDGTYEIKIKKPETKDAISFKFTRGSWESVEGNISGSAIANRSYTFTIVDDVKELSILSWTDLPPVGVADSFSFVKMTIPQLDDRVRTIRVYLPPDYKTAPDKRYPVIYMHDAQNIYAYSDKELSGKWNVDVALNKLFADKKIDGVIVVGIDNGTNRRGEYCPWVFDYKVGNAIGNGEGVKFAEFIVKMLKPKIDADYRTLADRENTAMIGSSTGAVITMYCGIKYQDIFSKVACLSANFIDGVNGVDLRKFITDTKKIKNMKIYIDMGTVETFLGTENSIIMADCEKMYNAVKEAGFTDVTEVRFEKITGAGHNESEWSKRFPSIFEWLN